MKNFREINVITCVNYLNLQRLLTLNNLLISLALAHETLKNIKTFEPNNDGNDKKKVALKQTLAQFWLFCDYLVLFAFHNNGEEPYNWIGLRAVKLNTHN